ncbi:hypothetical protein BDA99DRAFT_569999 [Phascolomyces articulosus]|uniref:Uncharacterized protein n=1 Tax=Phascolomyces articulosus TaxID=60185 RepID=A0AAD5KM17_9FUNG|nr:hypothetical protein BDA99DRAFT_569999 [Phascolomyces articulosus]
MLSNALGAGMINDVFDDHEKGRALSWYSSIDAYCTACTPLIEGVLAEFVFDLGVIDKKQLQHDMKPKSSSNKNVSSISFASLKLLRFPICCCAAYFWHYSLVSLFYLTGIVGNTVDALVAGSILDQTIIRRVEKAKSKVDMDDALKILYIFSRDCMRNNWYLDNEIYINRGMSTWIHNCKLFYNCIRGTIIRKPWIFSSNLYSGDKIYFNCSWKINCE